MSTTISAAVSGTDRPLPRAVGGTTAAVAAPDVPGTEGAAGITGAADPPTGAGGTGGSFALVTSLNLLRPATADPT